MFEKSLYDLIRGLRNHKGNEREYIQHSLQECRAEIRGPDMDLKATALLKLIYLEMFGHDMSWASFNVLEVMSSPKYLQKRVGYLGAVQSFRPDTEVLMLATNLLKKDINSPSVPTISLPLITLPHIITPSLAMSLLADLLPRLSHSNPSIRKKAIVALYRLALAYPETLRHAWPKIKDMLMNEDEDPSVTAAVINVICELGWRRPRDFLPLAPRLFDLLIDGGNNWMAIKIIKLFATLTPLEPRLIKKLLRPLMTLIQTTPAMSLLYECINGIIQGGILEGTDGAHEGEEVAAICVGKLRGMIASEGDPNLKYVALLAFNKIVLSHPHVVATHQDMIMNCINDPDVSIRLQALDLGSGMVNAENLISVVDRLMQQLQMSPLQNSLVVADEVKQTSEVEPAADSEGQDPEETLRLTKPHKDDIPQMLEEYRISVIHQILDMCSRNTYAYIGDFEWYIRVLVDLVRLIPVTTGPAGGSSILTERADDRISSAVGVELRNVAVRVGAVRADAVKASDSLVAAEGRRGFNSKIGAGGQGVLEYAAWIVGEYAEILPSPYDTLNSLVQPSVQTLGPEVIAAYLQAVPKLLVTVVASQELSWTRQFQTIISLLLAKTVHFFESLTLHPNLEVQERSVEFLELMRLAAEAVSNHEREDHTGPLLLTKAIPSLFRGLELNPVATSAQRKVPIPPSLDLDIPLNENLTILLHHAENYAPQEIESLATEQFYYQRPAKKTVQEPVAKNIPKQFDNPSSCQHGEGSLLDPSVTARKRTERRERNKDDPFYIANIDDSSSGTSTPFHDVLKTSNGTDVDIDSIPIMDLDLGQRSIKADAPDVEQGKRKRKHRQEIHIAADENIEGNDQEDQSKSETYKAIKNRAGIVHGKGKKSLLQVDSSGIGELGLDEIKEGDMQGQLDVYQKDIEDAEMEKALAEVEMLRLEMQRASERTQLAEDIPIEGTLVKKKRKKKTPLAVTTEGLNDEGKAKAKGIFSTTNEDVVSRKRKEKTMKKPIHTGQELQET